MDNTKNPETKLSGIIAESLEIMRNNSGQEDQTVSLMTELFRSLPGRTVSVTLILATIAELKFVTDQEADRDATAATARIELIGKLYQIAIARTTGDARDDLTRDLTFYYLAAGLNEQFIQWSDILLNTIQKNNIEYRATLFAIGAAQIFVNQWDKAKESFDRLLKDYPDAAEAYFGLALTYLKTGDTRHFESALEYTRRRAPDLGRIIDRLSVKGGFSMNDYMLEMNSLNDCNDG